MAGDMRRLQVRATRCRGCLYGPTPVVPRERQRQLIQDCTEIPFECHEGTRSGSQLRCRGWFDRNQGSVIVNLARLLGIVEFHAEGEDAARQMPQEGNTP